jgi:hypothetical protein
MLIKMRHISGKMPGYFVFFITFFWGVSVSVFGVCRTVFFWGGRVLQYMHRRYAFYCAAAIMLQCSNAMPSTDSISIAVYYAIWRVSASFAAYHAAFLLILGLFA